MAPTPWLVAYAALGVVALLASSVWRLTHPVLEAASEPIASWHWIWVLPWCAFMVYAEAYRGFHKQFCPRVVKRSFTLPTDRPWLWPVAPLVATGLLHATRKRLLVSRLLVAGIVLLVVGIRFIDQPVRGLIDLGVVLGLGGGTLSLIYHLGRAAMGQLPDVDPDWPEPAPPAR